MTGLSPQRVLLVDHSVDEREMYAEYFRSRGYCTLQAATARDGFRLAADLSPAIVIIDMKLPGDESGLDLADRLRSDEATASAVVIVLTGYSPDGDDAAAAAGRCDRFIVKPCLPDVLESTMTELMRVRA